MTDHPPIIFVDTETTGLDERLHQITEIAWCPLVGDSDRLILPHFTHNADQTALDISQHHARELWDTSNWASKEDIYGLGKTLTGAVIGGANVGFDTRFLTNVFPDRPWHYRPLDVEQYAAGALGLEVAVTLSGTAAMLRSMGYAVHHSDHTAQSDVLCARDVYIAARMYSMETADRRAVRLAAAEKARERAMG